VPHLQLGSAAFRGAQPCAQAPPLLLPRQRGGCSLRQRQLLLLLREISTTLKVQVVYFAVSNHSKPDVALLSAQQQQSLPAPAAAHPGSGFQVV